MTLHPPCGPTAHPEPDGPLDRQGPVIVFAISESFAMPLATAMRSLVEANAHHAPMDLRILHDGIPDPVRARIERSLPPGSAMVRWIGVDLGPLGRACPPEYASAIINARLLMPRLITDVRRVLYLDADILVLGPLDALWTADLGGAAAGAVTDAMDARLQAGDPDLADLPRVRRYFNSGVMLIDLDAWRARDVTARASDYLARFPQARYPDQNALNFVLDGDWRALGSRWNCQAHLRHHDLSRLPRARWPSIIHFVTAGKPWNPWVPNANAGLYDRVRARTAFARTPRERAWDGLLRVTGGFKERCKRGGPGLLLYHPARTIARFCRACLDRARAGRMRLGRMHPDRMRFPGRAK